MSSCLSATGQAFSSVGRHIDDSAQKIFNVTKYSSLWMGRQIVQTSRTVASYPPLSFLVGATALTVKFIQNNWKHLISFILAWTIIISGIGLLYGFQQTAWPLATGIGAGGAFGALSGILTANIFDRDKAHSDNNTMWNFINHAFNSLDANGTRAIVISVAVTVLLATAVVFPMATGVVLGFIVFNHLITKIGQESNLGHGLSTIERLEKKLQELEIACTQLRQEIQQLKMKAQQNGSHFPEASK